MYARVTTLQGSPGSFEEGRKALEQQILPAVRQMKGFRGLLSLGDRNTGRGFTISLWESEEAMRQSEEAANQLRASSAASMDSQVAGVERFEVILDATGAAAA